MTTMNHNELNEMELKQVNGGEGGLMTEEEINRLVEIIHQSDIPVPVIPLPVNPDFDPENGPLHVTVYPGMEM